MYILCWGHILSLTVGEIGEWVEDVGAREEGPLHRSLEHLPALCQQEVVVVGCCVLTYTVEPSIRGPPR